MLKKKIYDPEQDREMSDTTYLNMVREVGSVFRVQMLKVSVSLHAMHQMASVSAMPALFIPPMGKRMYPHHVGRIWKASSAEEDTAFAAFMLKLVDQINQVRD